MNLVGDGLLLLVARHELRVRERAYLNASPRNSTTSRTFLAPPARQSPKERVAFRSFTGSAPIDSLASSRGWLTQKRSAYQDARPARRPVSSCRRRAGLLANRGVAPGGLAGTVETRTTQVIDAPAFFGGPRGEVSTARLQTGLRPVEAPFHETSVTGLRPVGQDCSAATLGPSANAGRSSGALDSLAKVAPGPTPSTASSSPSALGFGSALLTWSSPLAPAADALEEDGSEEPAAPGRTTGPRGEPSPAALAARAFSPPASCPLWLDVSRNAEPVRAGQAPPTARPSLHQHTEGHPWGNTSRHRRSSALDGIALLATSSPSARALRQTPWRLPNKGLHPTRAARGRVKPRSLGGCLSC
jgi:hypothetical protein